MHMVRVLHMSADCLELSLPPSSNFSSLVCQATHQSNVKFVLFCDVWLIERARRERSYLLWLILLCLVDRHGRESMIVHGMVHDVILG